MLKLKILLGLVAIMSGCVWRTIPEHLCRIRRLAGLFTVGPVAAILWLNTLA